MIEDYSVNNEAIDNVYSRGLLTPPTPFKSAFRSAEGGFITGYKWIGDIYNKAYGLPENNELKDTLQMIQQERNVEGQSLTQRSTNWIADMVGYAVNPIVAGLTIAGAGIGGVAASTAGRLAPKAITPFLERAVGNKTVGEIGKHILESGTAGAASGIPIAFEEGSAKDAFMMGGLGIVFGSIPIAHGILKSKKSLTPKESKFLESYESKSESIPELEEQASSILKDEGHDVDSSTHQLPFYVMDDVQVRNLQAAVTDSISSNVSNKNYLTDYFIENSIDSIRDNPKSIKILQAYDNFITGKLASKESIINEADRINFVNMNKKISNVSLLSQPEIQKAIKNFSREESHVSNLPFTVPYNLRKRMAIDDKISKLKQKSPNKQVERRILELEKSKPKILKPKEELKQLYKSILEKKGYRNKLSDDFQRLQELSDHWPQAKSIMDRVKLEDDYEKQETIKSFLDTIRKAVESPSGKLAEPKKVEQYLRQRIDSLKPKQNKQDKTPDQKISEISKVPENIDQVLKDQEEYVYEMDVKNLGKDFEIDKQRITQFKKSNGALNDFIQCIMGTTNA